MVSYIRYCVLILVLSLNLQAEAQGRRSGDEYTGNPIIPGYFADPTIVVANNKYYIYATIDPWGGDSLALWVSDDFKNWQRKTLNWPTKQLCKSPTSNNNKVWAPSVVLGPDKKYHMFVSVGSEVYAGVSDHPEGPWQNVKADGSPLITTQKAINVHTIDAEAFIDDHGEAYLYWGSGWNWKDGHCYVGKLNKTMDGFIETPKDVTPPNYFEGPYMLKRNGVYYLMYSDGKCTDSTYKIRYSTSITPMGPWIEDKNSPILTSNMSGHIIGPGHHTVLKHKGKYYIIYHRISYPLQKDLLRELCIDEMSFDRKGNINKIKPTKRGVIIK